MGGGSFQAFQAFQGHQEKASAEIRTNVDLEIRQKADWERRKRLS